MRCMYAENGGAGEGNGETGWVGGSWAAAAAAAEEEEEEWRDRVEWVVLDGWAGGRVGG